MKIRHVLGRVRPRAARSLEESESLDFRRYISKGLEPLVRGSVHRWRLGECEQLFFLGRSARILSPSLLRLGANCFIGDFSYIDCYGDYGVSLGDYVTIREFAWIQLTSLPGRKGAGVTVGDRAYIGPRAYLGAGGPIEIGADCQLGGGVSLIAEEHEFRQERLVDLGVRRTGITIGEKCWIGHGVTVLDGVTIGEGCVVGAGSVVTRSVPAHHLALGIPATWKPINNDS